MENPLVSIIVITYNSSKYVLETLKSAYNQTYQNIELIVSDDCSTDNTVEICKQWIDEHSERFVRIELITSDINTGIPANCNRGWKASNGEWIKSIAGDDLLFDNCIEIGMNYVKSHSDLWIFSSFTLIFSDDVKYKQIHPYLNSDRFFQDDATSKEQFDILIKENKLLAPSIFFKRTLLILMDGFDENIKYMEDYPFWIKVTQGGYVIKFLPQVTVKYRMHLDSVSQSVGNEIFSNFYKRDFEYRKKYLWSFYKPKEQCFFRFKFCRNNFFCNLKLNKKKYKLLYKLSERILKVIFS